MKIFFISIPKAGTYLMRELIYKLDFGNSFLHISKKGIYDYSKLSYKMGRKHPRFCLTHMPLNESFNKIPEDSFGFGHLSYSDEAAELLKPFKIIFIGRPIKETILSHMIWMKESGRAQVRRNHLWLRETDPQKQFMQYIRTHASRHINTYKKILPWKDLDNVEVFDYNKLIKFPRKEIKRLAKYLDAPLTKSKLTHIIDDTLYKKTLTLSSEDTPRIDYWSIGAHEYLNDLIAVYGIKYEKK